MDALLLALVVFSAQLLVVTSVAAVAESLGRVTDPRLRLTYWRSVTLACLALPFSSIVGPEASTHSVVTFLVAPLGSGESASVASLVLPAAGRVLWWLLCAGALLRLSWLLAGALSLRQLRQRSRAATLTPDLEAVRAEVAPRAELRVSCELDQPASFGLRHPVVLLPERFFAMDPNAQRAVACHELLHVARCDWPWIVLEEVGRALFWYHPAAWLLVGRIQESREQLVDRLVVARIPSKRAYMAALLAFADTGRPVALATAFLKKRHLRSRLQKLVKESVMSRRRFAWTSVVLGLVMSAAIAGTVVALPLARPAGHADGDAQDDNERVTKPTVISEVKPQYTPEAMKARIQGSVMMTAVVRTDGTPDDIQVIKSLDAEYGLDKQAVAALSLWRFAPGTKGGKPVAVQVTVEMQFTLKK
jgi:TonB family protein